MMTSSIATVDVVLDWLHKLHDASRYLPKGEFAFADDLRKQDVEALCQGHVANSVLRWICEHVMDKDSYLPKHDKCSETKSIGCLEQEAGKLEEEVRLQSDLMEKCQMKHDELLIKLQEKRAQLRILLERVEEQRKMTEKLEILTMELQDKESIRGSLSMLNAFSLKSAQVLDQLENDRRKWASFRNQQQQEENDDFIQKTLADALMKLLEKRKEREVLERDIGDRKLSVQSRLKGAKEAGKHCDQIIHEMSKELECKLLEDVQEARINYEKIAEEIQSMPIPNPNQTLKKMQHLVAQTDERYIPIISREIGILENCIAHKKSENSRQQTQQGKILIVKPEGWRNEETKKQTSNNAAQTRITAFNSAELSRLEASWPNDALMNDALKRAQDAKVMLNQLHRRASQAILGKQVEQIKRTQQAMNETLDNFSQQPGQHVCEWVKNRNGETLISYVK